MQTPQSKKVAGTGVFLGSRNGSLNQYKGQILYNSLPAYRLRSLDGQPVIPGDSGGGIWYKGTLIGNNWVTLMETSGSGVETSGNSGEENINYTDLSYAAIFPLVIP